MKSIKTTALLALILSGTTVAATMKSASAQVGVDPWTGAEYDTSNCVGYNSCYVDSWGNVSGSNNLPEAYDYQYDPTYTNEYRQLQ